MFAALAPNGGETGTAKYKSALAMPPVVGAWRESSGVQRRSDGNLKSLISGVVRPQDITGSNTVLSSQIADAEVQIVGKGVLSEAQRPGILYRLLDWLGLF